MSTPTSTSNKKEKFVPLDWNEVNKIQKAFEGKVEYQPYNFTFKNLKVYSKKIGVQSSTLDDKNHLNHYNNAIRLNLLKKENFPFYIYVFKGIACASINPEGVIQKQCVVGELLSPEKENYFVTFEEYIPKNYKFTHDKNFAGIDLITLFIAITEAFRVGINNVIEKNKPIIYVTSDGQINFKLNAGNFVLDYPIIFSAYPFFDNFDQMQKNNEEIKEINNDFDSIEKSLQLLQDLKIIDSKKYEKANQILKQIKDFSNKNKTINRENNPKEYNQIMGILNSNFKLFFDALK